MAKLEVNVDAQSGWLQVELLDEMGKGITGFSDKTAKKYESVDELRLLPKWENNIDLSPMTGKTVKLRFTLQHAALYAFEFR